MSNRIIVLNDPVNLVDPWGLDPNRLYPNQKFNPTNKVPKMTPTNVKFIPGKSTPIITPENYNPNGINNMPGKKIPVSDNIAKCKKGVSGTFNLIDKVNKMLQGIGGGWGAPVIILVAPPAVLDIKPNFRPPVNGTFYQGA